MLLHFVFKTISGTFPDIAIIPEKCFFRNNIFILTSIFYPSGEQISPRRLRRDSFAVVYYSFISHVLVAAAIFARE
jgi:hypothetical protein